MVSQGRRTTRTPSPHVAARPQFHHETFGQVGTAVSGVARVRESAVVARPDSLLLLAVLGMVILGLLMVQSASQFADPTDPLLFARRDLVWALCGGVVLLVTAQIDYQRWRRVAIPGIVVALGLLALVIKVGASVGGAQRWLSFGSFLTFQPSEAAKLAFIIFAADWLAQRKGALTLRRVAPLGVVTAALIGIVLLQNDLGTALVLTACAVALLVVAGLPLRQLALLILTSGVIGTIVIAGTPFRRARILAFLHPLQCQSDVARHICQSLIALGSGGLWGRGLGDSLQKAGYLPAPFTDSIFAVIGEELGLWGALLVVALVALILWRGLRIARQSLDTFGALLASGITCWLVVQALLNIGSSVAAIPFTGVPLPFISFGGSSLVVSLAAVGILLNISLHGAPHLAKSPAA